MVIPATYPNRSGDIPGRWPRGHRVFRRRYSESPVWKKLAIAPAEPAMTSTAQISRKTSTTRPGTLSGFLIWDDTVRSGTLTHPVAPLVPGRPARAVEHVDKGLDGATGEYWHQRYDGSCDGA